MTIDTDFVIYAHFTADADELFYVGEGRPDRATSKFNRSRWWNFKAQKHGFYAEILISGLSKEEAEEQETELIRLLKELGTNLINICIGPAFKDPWILRVPKEEHPMFGKRFKAPWISESNRRRVGEKRNVNPEDTKRLIERNKNGTFKRFMKPIKCIETGEIFPSIKAAGEKYGIRINHIARDMRAGGKTGGFHWEYL